MEVWGGGSRGWGPAARRHVQAARPGGKRSCQCAHRQQHGRRCGDILDPKIRIDLKFWASVCGEASPAVPGVTAPACRGCDQDQAGRAPPFSEPPARHSRGLRGRHRLASSTIRSLRRYIYTTFLLLLPVAGQPTGGDSKAAPLRSSPTGPWGRSWGRRRDGEARRAPSRSCRSHRRSSAHCARPRTCRSPPPALARLHASKG